MNSKDLAEKTMISKKNEMAQHVHGLFNDLPR